MGLLVGVVLGMVIGVLTGHLAIWTGLGAAFGILGQGVAGARKHGKSDS